MIKHIIVMDIETSISKRIIRVYMKRDNVFKEIEQLIDKSLDTEAYISERIGRLWEFGTLMPQYFWDSAYGAKPLDIQVNTFDFDFDAEKLDELTKSLENDLGSEEYNKLKTLVSSAKAAERNEFFAIIGYLLISKMTQ